MSEAAANGLPPEVMASVAYVEGRRECEVPIMAGRLLHGPGRHGDKLRNALLALAPGGMAVMLGRGDAA